jgi:hypothetical protein
MIEEQALDLELSSLDHYIEHQTDSSICEPDDFCSHKFDRDW